MKLHALIVGVGFVPYFLLEATGKVEIPMVGLSALDESYKLTPYMTLSLCFQAITWAIVAYLEYSAKMEGKLFFAYHIPLSAAVAFWQLQPTTTTLGQAFFALPHVFTLWSTYIVLSKGKEKLI